MLAHDLTQLSAALTYYTVLSLLPALIVIVSLLGMVGLQPDTVHSLLDTVGELGAPWAAEFVSTTLESVLRSQNSGVVFGVSLVFSLWAASAYVGSFMAASDRIYEIVHRRPFWTGIPLRLGLALALLVLLSVTAAAVALVGPFGQWVADATGIGRGPLHLWTWAKWPLLIALGLLLFTLLYKFTPSRGQPALWWLLPGASVGIALWIGASAALQSLPRQLRLVQPRVRHPRRRGGVPRVGLAAQHRPARRGRGEPRGRVPEGGKARHRRRRAREPGRERIIGVHANRRARPPADRPPVTPCPS